MDDRAADLGAVGETPETLQLKAHLGCPICKALAEAAWKQATQWVLLEAEVPDVTRLHRLMRHACEGVAKDLSNNIVISRVFNANGEVEATVFRQHGTLVAPDDIHSVTRVCLALVAVCGPASPHPPCQNG